MRPLSNIPGWPPTRVEYFSQSAKLLNVIAGVNTCKCHAWRALHLTGARSLDAEKQRKDIHFPRAFSFSVSSALPHLQGV